VRVSAVFLSYLAGVGIGLWRIYAPPVRRTVLALAWPVGLVAAICTLLLLGAASLVLFPILGMVVAAAAVLGWLLW
jgi:hypothetical protein